MKSRSPLLRNKGFQTLLSSLVCIILGILVGYVVLLIINPEGAWEGLKTILKNFFNYPTAKAQAKYLGATLVKTAPLLLCSLSILFAYKVGLFNIGAAGQYVAGAALSLYAALAWHMPWWLCMILAILAGALLGGISGVLKAKFNVNEVISGIMLNWIGLYSTNMLLNNVKEETSPFTYSIKGHASQAMIPSLGLEKLFSKNTNVTIAIPLSILVAVIIWIVLDKTRFGYELKATGNNKNAAKYAGMKENRNIILTLVIAGGLAGLAAASFYLSGYEQWECTQSSVPAMGFNGIAAAFLGGLNPIGAIFSSFFIQHITLGGSYLDKTLYSSEISDLMSSIIIYLCGFVLFFKHFMNSLLDSREAKKAEKRNADEKGGSDK